MITFEVNDMTCGHCVSTITKAVKAVDNDAKVQVDLAQHRVFVEPATADADELADAIKEAGYTPVPVEAD
jgi:copper chaperone